jgi:branched-chain amino acid transport system permease protein
MTVFQTLFDGLTLGSLFALAALGLAIVFSVLQLINFAHGELLMIGGYTIFVLRGLNAPLLLLATLIVVVGAALVMERVAFRPLRQATASTMLIASFAVSMFLQQAIQARFGARPRSVRISSIFVEPFEILGLRLAKGNLITIGVTAAVLVALLMVLTKTRTGVEMRAAAEDFRMARLLGIRADRVIAAAFAISGLLAAVTSVLWLGQTGTLTPTFGLTPVIVAFIAIVLGGMGNLAGAIVGGYFVGVVTVALQSFLPIGIRGYREAFVFLAVIGILLIRPRGLLPSKALEERV